MSSSGGVYNNLTFPVAPRGRPYAFINMVCTIDGKSVSGDRTEPVGDLGSNLDHQTMRQLEEAADGILIGAGNLRSTPGLWYPSEKLRFVATSSGRIDYGSRFFSDSPDKAYVLCPDDVQVKQPFGKLPNDFSRAFEIMKNKLGLQVLLIEGGSTLNGELLRAGLVDELFLTIAPKIKLGECEPTYAGGRALPKGTLQLFSLVEHHQVGDEIFIRYRRKP